MATDHRGDRWADPAEYAEVSQPTSGGGSHNEAEQVSSGRTSQVRPSRSTFSKYRDTDSAKDEVGHQSQGAVSSPEERACDEHGQRLGTLGNGGARNRRGKPRRD